jgi:hypothetical protein
MVLHVKALGITERTNEQNEENKFTSMKQLRNTKGHAISTLKTLEKD